MHTLAAMQLLEPRAHFAPGSTWALALFGFSPSWAQAHLGTGPKSAFARVRGDGVQVTFAEVREVNSQQVPFVGG